MNTISHAWKVNRLPAFPALGACKSCCWNHPDPPPDNKNATPPPPLCRMLHPVLLSLCGSYLETTHLSHFWVETFRGRHVRGVAQAVPERRRQRRRRRRRRDPILRRTVRFLPRRQPPETSWRLHPHLFLVTPGEREPAKEKEAADIVDA